MASSHDKTHPHGTSTDTVARVMAAPAGPRPLHGYVIDAQRRRPQAVEDLRDGLANWYLWGSLGIHDIRSRYRRAYLGPLWLTLSLGVMTLAIAVLFGGVFQRDLATFMPYVAVGLVVWGLISNTIVDASNAFIHKSDMARNLTFPLSIHVIRALWRNLIVLGHNILVPIALIPFVTFGFNINSWLAIPGFVLVVLNLGWAAFILAVISTRYRDIPPLVINLLQLIFLLTPVFWSIDLLPERLAFIAWNPFFAMIDLIRAPLLGAAPMASSWWIALAGIVVGYPLAIHLWRLAHWRITYWL